MTRCKRSSRNATSIRRSTVGWRRSSSPSTSAAAELGGRLRPHPVRRSTETGLLAALAPRLGGSADGADRSQKIARINPLAHPLRARGWSAPRDGAIRACDGPTGAAPTGFSPIRWHRGGDRPHHRGRPGRWRRGIIEVDRRSTASSRSTRTTGRCELGGLLRQHPLRRSAATALLAPLLLRFGGSVSGADRSAEIARVNSLARSALAPFWWQHLRR